MQVARPPPAAGENSCLRGKEVRVHVLALHAGPPRPAPQTHQWTADAGRAGPDGTPWNHEPNE